MLRLRNTGHSPSHWKWVPPPVRWAGAVVLAIALGACGRDENAASYPAPGHLTAVSVAPLNASGTTRTAANLISGGEFAVWWAGAFVPEGFEPSHIYWSTLTRLRKEQGSGYLARQTWSKSDAARSFVDHLRVEVPDLGPNEDYELAVTVSGTKGDVVHISLWEAPLTGPPLLLEKDFIVTQPCLNSIKQYSRAFTTRSGGTLIVAAHGDSATNANTAVTWHQWRLTRSGEGP